MIKIIVLDVDGTLTDGKIYTDDRDNNFKAFDVKDGFAIAQWINYGGKVAIITGKKSNIVQRRGEELGIQYIHQGIKNKVEELKKILEIEKLTFKNVAYIGDDINDLGVITKVKFSACPKNSVSEVLEKVDFISKFNGGEGAVREVFEHLMKKNGMWDKVISHYLNQK